MDTGSEAGMTGILRFSNSLGGPILLFESATNKYNKPVHIFLGQQWPPGRYDGLDNS